MNIPCVTRATGFWILSCFMLIATASGARGAAGSNTTERLVKRQATMSNVMVVYTRVTEDTPNRELVVRLGEDPDLSRVGKRVYRERFTYLDGLARYESIVVSQPQRPQSRGAAVVEWRAIYGRDRVETLYRMSNDESPSGTITDTLDLPDEWAIEQGLGLRAVRGPWITPEAIRSFASRDSGGLVEVSWRDSAGSTHTWSFVGEASPQLQGYRVVTAGGRIIVELTASGFEMHAGVAVPRNVTVRRISYAYDQRHVVQTTVLELSEIEVGTDNNKATDYVMTWPRGTLVHDRRLDVLFRITTGDRSLGDEDILDILSRPAVAGTRPSAEERESMSPAE
jgi:hypothetical protein